MTKEILSLLIPIIAIVMGCAGMARHRRPLEQALGIPVIDPTQAAVTMALGTVQFSHH